MKKLITVLLLFSALTPLLVSCINQGKGPEAQQSYIDSLKLEVTSLTTAKQQEEDNKKQVADFYQELFGDKDVNAIDKYIGDVYIQHNPALPDGKEALKKGATQWFQGAPKEKIDLQHLGADGDLVYIHTKSKMGPKTVSVIDIFRLDKGKIVEHWDVLQDVPEKSANAHPMF